MIAQARARGFTLIEMAVAMFVLALLLGSILVPLSTQVEQRQISDTQKMMEEIKESLLGFAAANSYLPCPDTDGDGRADPAAPGVCTSAKGWVPWATLGVAQGDAWGNRFLYRVSPEFTNTPLAGACTGGDLRISLCDNGNITVNTRIAAKATQAVALNAVAVIVSQGRNGLGGTSTTGSARAPTIAGTDEATNAAIPGTTTFVTRTQTPAATGCSDTAAGQPYCEFDDLVTWVSAFTVFNRMIAAGRLP